MKYEVEEIKEGKFWNSFVGENSFVNILSSWEWIEFEKSLGYNVFPYGIFENNVLKGVFAFRKINARRGKYLLLKQNVFLDWNDEELISTFIDFLKLKSKELNCSFFRIAPPLLSPFENEIVFQKFGFKKSFSKTSDGQVTSVLDLSKNIEDILLNMRKNTRYLIRKGEKIGVEVFNVDSDEYLEDFEKIYLETVKRNNWDAEEFEYIRKQFKQFSSKGLSRMFVAKYNGKILAASIFTQFNKQVIYHHSASVTEKGNVPGMYVLLWEAIKYYKGLGLKEFNFFGVCEKSDTNHSWYGLSLFKRGFGGDERKLVFNYDFPLSLAYYKTRILEKFLS